MTGLIRQISTVAGVFIQTIPDRRGMTSATFFSIAIVVSVLLVFLALGNGFRTTLLNTGSSTTAMILKNGASSELNSSLSQNDIGIIESILLQNHSLKPDSIYHDAFMIVDTEAENSSRSVNVAMRGVQPHRFNGSDLNITQGRLFRPGENEIIIGTAIQSKLTGAAVGEVITLGNHQWLIAGIFEAGGSVYESEILADITTLQNFYRRTGIIQAIRFPLISDQDLLTVKLMADRDQRLDIKVITEAQYYQEQSRAISNFIFYLGWPISIVMALGALSSALSTMHNSVAQKKRDIATLRAIGFTGSAVFWGTLLESLLLALLAGVFGGLVSYLAFDGITTMTRGGNFSQVVFALNFSFHAIYQGVFLALCIGLLGGVVPAFVSSRIMLADAFRNT